MSATPRPMVTVEYPQSEWDEIMRRYHAHDAMQDDLYAIARAFDLPALPYSGHKAVQRDILPAIERMKNTHNALVEALRQTNALIRRGMVTRGVGVGSYHLDKWNTQERLYHNEEALRQAGAIP